MKRHTACWAVRLLVLAAAAAMSPACAHSQSISVDERIDQSYRAMYNLEFDEAFRQAEAAKALAPDDPTPLIAEACAVLFREFDRLHILTSEMFASDEKFNARKAQTWNPAAKKQFDDTLSSAEKMAQQRLDRDKNDVKALFAMTMIYGLRADDAALIGKKNLTALAYTKTGTAYAERLLARKPDYYDAYVATGMGKYLIGGKAAPVRWVLRLGGLKGDQEEGVRELTLAADKGRHLAPFARILLAFNDLRRKDKAEARKKLAWLSSQYPNNPLFLREIAKLDRPVETGQ